MQKLVDDPWIVRHHETEEQPVIVAVQTAKTEIPGKGNRALDLWTGRACEQRFPDRMGVIADESLVVVDLHKTCASLHFRFPRFFIGTWRRAVILYRISFGAVHVSISLALPVCSRHNGRGPDALPA